MRFQPWIAACAWLVLSFSAPAAPAPDQAALEKSFDAEIHPDQLRDWMKIMAAEPNQVGSPHDKANADYEAGLLKGWGWDVRIETFEVLYPTPIAEPGAGWR
jgi:N-acetylated-alpha-linked acidic dipeptidase